MQLKIVSREKGVPHPPSRSLSRSITIQFHSPQRTTNKFCHLFLVFWPFLYWKVLSNLNFCNNYGYIEKGCAAVVSLSRTSSHSQERKPLTKKPIFRSFLFLKLLQICPKVHCTSLLHLYSSEANGIYIRCWI